MHCKASICAIFHFSLNVLYFILILEDSSFAISVWIFCIHLCWRSYFSSSKSSAFGLNLTLFVIFASRNSAADINPGLFLLHMSLTITKRSLAQGGGGILTSSLCFRIWGSERVVHYGSSVAWSVLVIHFQLGLTTP